MAELTEIPQDAVKSVGSGLSHKLGPLPVWGWLIAGAGVIGVVFWWHNQSIANGGQGIGGIASAGTPWTGGNGTPTTAAATDSSVLPVISNTTWLQNVAGQVAASLQIPESEVRLYLGQYLNGGQPSGSASASSLYNKVIDAANAIMPIPNAPSAVQSGASPYQNFGSWLNDLMSYLPSGTPSSVGQEISNVVNGLSSTLSPAAAYAFEQAQSIVGNGPSPINYSVSPAVTSSDIFAISAVPGAHTGTFQSWLSAIRTTLPNLATVPDAVWANVWNTLEGSGAAAYSSGSNGVDNQVALINSTITGWLANPSSVTMPAIINPHVPYPNAVTVRKVV